MLGYSKFANVKHKKEKDDTVEDRIFTVISREIAVVVKEGGPDSANNSKLQDVIVKAKTNNVPNDVINNNIRKAADGPDSVNYEQNVYEGYGPSGVAITVKTLTGNKNRTVANVRAVFSRDGGNVGTLGCISFIFDRKGQIIIDKEEYEMDPDELMMFAFDTGAGDFADSEDSYEVLMDPGQSSAIREAFEQKGIPVLEADVRMTPRNWVGLKSGKDQKKMQRILDLLDKNDDIQAIFHSWDERQDSLGFREGRGGKEPPPLCHGGERGACLGKFLNAVSAVFVAFSLMAVGILLGKLKFMTVTKKRFISRYVINIAVPLSTIVGIQKNLKHSDMLEMGQLLLAPLITILTCPAVSVLVAKMLKLPKRRSDVSVALAFLSNTLFIGFPMAQELFGDVSLPYVMTYHICSTAFIQTVVLILVECSGEAAEQTGKKQNLSVSLFVKPPILGIIAACVPLLLDIRLPRITMSLINYVSATVAPLALFYCGSVIHELRKESLCLGRGIPAMITLRLLFAPLVSILVTQVLGITGLLQRAFLIEAALSSILQITVMAGVYDTDEQYAAIGLILSTIGIFIMVPTLMALFRGHGNLF